MFSLCYLGIASILESLALSKPSIGHDAKPSVALPVAATAIMNCCAARKVFDTAQVSIELTWVVGFWVDNIDVVTSLITLSKGFLEVVNRTIFYDKKM